MLYCKLRVMSLGTESFLWLSSSLASGDAASGVSATAARGARDYVDDEAALQRALILSMKEAPPASAAGQGPSHAESA